MKESILHQIFTKSVGLNRRIVFPEAGIDPRVLNAVSDLEKAGAVSPILLSIAGNVQSLADEIGVSFSDDVTIIDAGDEQGKKDRVAFFEEKLSHKNPTKEQVLKLASDPVMAAGWLVATGQADGAVAGSIASTADVIRAALRTIGTAEGAKLVSSSFLMEMPDGNVFTYADCGVVPYPDAGQLADIAITSGYTHQILTGGAFHRLSVFFNKRQCHARKCGPCTECAVNCIKKEAGVENGRRAAV